MATNQVKAWGFYLNGQWRTDGETQEVRAASDQHVLATVTRARREHVEAAILAASSAFEITRKLSAYERQRVLRSVAAGFEERPGKIARALAL